MRTVRAVFENGVFRPTGQVELPEKCEVEFEPRVVNGQSASAEALKAIYSTLSKRFDSGQSDVAARHDEHQP